MALFERLFADGIVTMGPSRWDPDVQVATLNAARMGALSELRRIELEKFSWLAGDWTFENPVPATRISPSYCDRGKASFALSDDRRWICAVMPGGRLEPMITFDPCSRTWMYLLTLGSYGLLRSSGWKDQEIVFTGLMTMIGIECEWQMHWTRIGDDEFRFVNSERDAGGSWLYIDEWRYRRA